jgi:dTDP-4-dehydrorhamnose 3,5-epimerase
MNVIHTALPGCLLIEPQIFPDERGFFFESYNEKKMPGIGIDHRFVQITILSLKRTFCADCITRYHNPKANSCALWLERFSTSRLISARALLTLASGWGSSCLQKTKICCGFLQVLPTDLWFFPMKLACSTRPQSFMPPSTSEPCFGTILNSGLIPHSVGQRPCRADFSPSREVCMSNSTRNWRLSWVVELVGKQRARFPLIKYCNEVNESCHMHNWILML